MSSISIPEDRMRYACFCNVIITSVPIALFKRVLHRDFDLSDAKISFITLDVALDCKEGQVLEP